MGVAFIAPVAQQRGVEAHLDDALAAGGARADEGRGQRCGACTDEGRPAYVRVSDHWGRFESREADLSQFQPERDTMDASGWPSFWKSHDWQLDGAQPGERQAGYVLLDELPDAGRDGAVVRRSEKADDIEVGTKGLAKGMFRAPGGNWMDTREAALADAQRQNAARQTYQQEAQRRSDYNAHMGALAMANGELPTDALRRYGINGSQRLDRVSRVLQDVLGCWRRFKIDQTCRLNFDQGLAPGF